MAVVQNQKSRGLKNKTHWFKNLLIPLLLILLAQGIDYRWDMTQDQRYTLSDNIKTLLSELEKPLKIDIFLTGKLPADYLRLHREITTLIKGMEEHTDQLVVGFINPFEGAASTEALIRAIISAAESISWNHHASEWMTNRKAVSLVRLATFARAHVVVHTHVPEHTNTTEMSALKA